MPLLDMSLEEMRSYKPARDEPEDFDDFWQGTLAEAREFDLNASFEPVDSGFSTLDVYDVTFSGFNGDRIKGWYMLPRGAGGPCPAWSNTSVMAADEASRRIGWLSHPLVSPTW